MDAEPKVRYARGFETLREELSAAELPVRGAFPPWLAGSLLRNGPACFEAGPERFRHWFDGQAMLHRFSVADGAVRYTNRYLDSPGLRAARGRGRIGYAEFATDPCRTAFQRFFTLFSGRPASHNANVNIVPLGDRFAALTETPLPVAFDPETLATIGVVGYQDALDGRLTTAHPHQDPATGDLVNYLLHFGPRSEYRVYRQRPGTLTREVVARHRTDRPAYMHSFAVTPHYAVLVAYPLRVFPPALALAGLAGRPFIENYRWEPRRGTDVIVLNLRDGSLRGVYPARPLFAFHHINAYEEGQELVVDLCAYPDASVVDALYLDRLRTGGPVPQALPTRLRVHLDSGRVDLAELADEPMELPRIDYARCNGRAYRHAYGVGSHDRRGGDFVDQLVRLDTGTGATTVWHEEGCYPGEPVFVPAPGAQREGDGVVLSVVLDAAAGSSFLLCLDAADFTELARAEVPHAVPFGFHGAFRPA